MKFLKEDFIFLPLGGSSEIGMNSNLYHYKGSWLMVDLGVSFADETMPGVDIILPDTDFIEEKKENLEAILLTHGHEDHMGAIQYIWDKLRVPVYGSAFTIALLKRKLKETGLLNEVPLKVFTPNESFEIGPFQIKPIRLTHSIPDPCSLTIKTEKGTIFHSGDWKFDPDPQVGNPTDFKLLKEIGRQGVLALVGDSTNANVEGRTKSEKHAFDTIKKVISNANGRIVITSFASNVARIRSIILASAECNKKVVLAGRSLQRVVEAATEVGYLNDIPDLVSMKDIDKIPHESLVVIAAGSQGEVRSTMTRIAFGKHDLIRIKPGDTAIFSSSKIPGNELAISRVHDAFSKKGITVITDKDDSIHVSGHPGIEDIKDMYNMLKPQISIPVHGTAKHISSHSIIASNCNVPITIEPENGSVIKLSGNSPGIIYQIPTKPKIPDGSQILKSNSNVLSLRRKMLWNGVVSAVIILDDECQLQLPIKVTQTGLTEVETESSWIREVSEEIEEVLEFLSHEYLKDDIKVEEKVRRAIRSVSKVLFERRPIINVHIIRVL